jgi:hypothetical protein
MLAGASILLECHRRDSVRHCHYIPLSQTRGKYYLQISKLTVLERLSVSSPRSVSRVSAGFMVNIVKYRDYILFIM